MSAAVPGTGRTRRRGIPAEMRALIHEAMSDGWHLRLSHARGGYVIGSVTPSDRRAAVQPNLQGDQR